MHISPTLIALEVIGEPMPDHNELLRYQVAKAASDKQIRSDTTIAVCSASKDNAREEGSVS
jgi:hypothetical protein